MIDRRTTSSELLQATCARFLSSSSIARQLEFSKIGTDSRKDLRGALFWALAGETHDGHEFLKMAVDQGAAGLVVHKIDPIVEGLAEKVAVFLVPDTLVALQDLARSHRKQLQGPVIGVTGSNGKTSTKEFLAAMMSPYRKVHWSLGSFNNHWGVPVSLLSAPLDSEVIILEMGMNHEGELRDLCRIAFPDVVACTLVGKTHMEHFGSVDKIAAAKNEIYLDSPAEATRIYNLDNPWTLAMAASALADYPQAKSIFGFSEKLSGGGSGALPEVRVSFRFTGQSGEGVKIEGQIDGQAGTAILPVLGAHHAINAMAAAAMALAVGLTPLEIWQALPHCRSAWGRMQLLKAAATHALSPQAATVLFDGYNASPDSYRVLLENGPSVADSLKAEKIFGVFAEMKELGVAAAAEHAALGRQAAAMTGKAFEKIWFYGPSHAAFREAFLSAGGSALALITSEDFDLNIAQSVVDELHESDLVFVKGSRGMKTERFVQLLIPGFSKS